MKKRNWSKRHRKHAKAHTIEKRTTKIVISPNNRRIIVDALMKPILHHLWGRGVKTLYSCAGHFPDFDAYIAIERNDDFEKYARNSPWKYRKKGMDTVHAYTNKDGYSQKNRALFLRWLLEY